MLKLKDLKSTKQPITELKNELAKKERMLSQFEQKLKGMVNAEPGSKDALVAELQEKLKASQSNQLGLEEKIARLQSQLSGLKAEQTAVTKIPASLKIPKKLPPQGDAPKKEADPPDPAAIIDWVLKKKSE